MRQPEAARRETSTARRAKGVARRCGFMVVRGESNGIEREAWNELPRNH
jgi:hypothetical protein